MDCYSYILVHTRWWCIPEEHVVVVAEHVREHGGVLHDAVSYDWRVCGRHVHWKLLNGNDRLDAADKAHDDSGHENLHQLFVRRNARRKMGRGWVSPKTNKTIEPAVPWCLHSRISSK